MTRKKLPAIAAVLGICMMTSFNVSAAVTRLPNEAGYLNMTVGKDVFTNSFASASSFIDDFKPDQFIRIKSVNNSFTTDDMFTAPRSQPATEAVYKDSSGTYGRLLASLGLMALIAYRRSYR